MKAEFWVIMLIVLLAISLFIMFGVIIYYRIVNRLKNGIVARIHMTDSTVQTHRYDVIPTDDRFLIKEYDSKGEESTFPYDIKPECIEKGRWGRYIDYDYHISEPISPKKRQNTPLMVELKEMFKHVGALLDSDLAVKLLRSSKFEDFARLMLLLILIFTIIGAGFAGTGMIKSFATSNHKGTSDCTLGMDNRTWETIYYASHVAPPSYRPQTNG